MRYGSYDLRRGDRDSNLTYGGEIRSASDGDTVPMDGEVGFVKQLQEDLFSLGFTLVGAADGIFGRNTTFAIREFQIYSKMPKVARQNTSSRRYSDSLESIDNPHPYDGPISGVANDATRTQLMNWIDHSLRCAVVIECWQMRSGRRANLFAGPANVYESACQNLWGHREIPNTAPRMFARDLSGYYDIPPNHQGDELFPLGDYQTYLTYSGPRSTPPIHTWPEAEILPASFIGTRYSSLNASQLSTFKVIRAVAEVECKGFYDSVNAYDNAIQSLGPCHWTLGIVSSNGSVSAGELCAFLSYLRHVDPQAYEKAFGVFGVSVEEAWEDNAGVGNGVNLWQASSRKYVGNLRQQDDSGTFTHSVGQEADANYFKNWHWFYRLVMAGRTIPEFQRRMYDFARVRLRDIASTPFRDGVGGLPAGTTLGDVYTSERAIALLLRWHIRYPARVVSGGRVANSFRSSSVGVLQTAYENAMLNGSAIGSWGNTEERSLVGGIVTEVNNLGNAGFQGTMRYLRDWPSNWGNNPRRYQLPVSAGRLSVDRESFSFDDTGLPPAP